MNKGFKKSGMVVLAVMLIFCIAFVMQNSAFAGTVKLPKTGQTTSYATGDDGDLEKGVAWPSPRFTVGTGIEADCVTDNLTGLMWAKNANLPNGTRTWQGALDYIASLNSSGGLCGYTDWRLPNINELESFVHAGESNTATWLNSQGFTNVQSTYYWSSTTYAYNTLRAWGVDMGSRHVFSFYKSTTYYYVWPVRGTTTTPAQLWKTGQTTSYATGDDGDLERGVTWPSPRFTDNGNGTVTDNLTGLVWLKNADCFGVKTWADALNSANNLADGQCGLTDGSSAGDWRLPNRKELRSLIDYSKDNPPLPTGHPFSNVQLSKFYWSSTSDSTDSSAAFYVNMQVGFVLPYNKSESYYVWPVRDRQAVAVPTMTEWGMILFMVLAGLGSVYYLRKRVIGNR